MRGTRGDGCERMGGDASGVDSLARPRWAAQPDPASGGVDSLAGFRRPETDFFLFLKNYIGLG